MRGKTSVAEEKGEERIYGKEGRIKRKKRRKRRKGERIMWEKKESGKN